MTRLVLRGIDVGHAGVADGEVQAVGRDDALEQMVRRARVLLRGSPLGLSSVRTAAFSNLDGTP